jgi:hypothetical protein
MDKTTARKVVEILLECSGKIDGSVALVQKTCSDPEFRAYRKACGEVMGTMYTDILRGIFKEYPDLKPEALDF